MKKSTAFSLLALLFVLASCGRSKKVLVMSSGKLSIEGTTVSVDPGTTHEEKELTVSGDKITVNWVDNKGDKRTDAATVA